MHLHHMITGLSYTLNETCITKGTLPLQLDFPVLKVLNILEEVTCHHSHLFYPMLHHLLSTIEQSIEPQFILGWLNIIYIILDSIFHFEHCLCLPNKHKVTHQQLGSQSFPSLQMIIYLQSRQSRIQLSRAPCFNTKQNWACCSTKSVST